MPQKPRATTSPCSSTTFRAPSKRPAQWPSSFARLGTNRPTRPILFGRQVSELCGPDAKARTSSSPKRPTGSPLGLPKSKPQERPRPARVSEAESAYSGTLDTLLERTSATLEQIRSGIDVQAAAVGALVEQASAGIGKAGADAAEIAGDQHQPGEQLAGRTLQPGSRAGARIAAHACGDRTRARLDRRALH